MAIVLKGAINLYPPKPPTSLLVGEYEVTKIAIVHPCKMNLSCKTNKAFGVGEHYVVSSPMSPPPVPAPTHRHWVLLLVSYALVFWIRHSHMATAAAKAVVSNELSPVHLRHRQQRVQLRFCIALAPSRPPPRPFHGRAPPCPYAPIRSCFQCVALPSHARSSDSQCIHLPIYTTSCGR